MSTARKILSNTGIQILGKAIITVIALVFITKPLTGLGDTYYGEYAFVYRFLGFFAIFADFGLFTIAVREMAEYRDQQAKIIGNIFSIRTLLVVGVMIIAGLAGMLAGYLDPKFTPTIQMGIWLAGASVVFTMMATTLTSVFQVHYKMFWPTVATVVAKAVMAIITIWALTKLGTNSIDDFWVNNFHWFFIAGILGNFALFAITWWYARKLIDITPRFDFKFWKENLRKALPYGLALILNTFYYQIDSLMILPLRKDGSAEVGAYDVSFKIIEILNIIPIYFLNAVLPLLTASLANEALSKKIVDYCWRFLLAVSAPIFFGGLALAPQIIAIIVKNPTEGYFAYSPLALNILLLSMIFIFLNSIFGFTLIAQKRQNELLKINAICLAFNVIANYFAITTWGFLGAAGTTVLSEILVLSLSMHAVHQQLKFRISISATLKILLAGAGMFALLWIMRDYSIKYTIPLGGVIYFILLWSLRGIPVEAWSVIRRKPISETEHGEKVIDV